VKPIPLHMFVNHPMNAVLLVALLAFFGTPIYMAIRQYLSRRGLDG
jgi:hypothetical protein